MKGKKERRRERDKQGNVEKETTNQTERMSAL